MQLVKGDYPAHRLAHAHDAAKALLFYGVDPNGAKQEEWKSMAILDKVKCH